LFVVFSIANSGDYVACNQEGALQVQVEKDELEGVFILTLIARVENDGQAARRVGFDNAVVALEMGWEPEWKASQWVKLNMSGTTDMATHIFPWASARVELLILHFWTENAYSAVVFSIVTDTSTEVCCCDEMSRMPKSMPSLPPTTIPSLSFEAWAVADS
jgi:hypothetical protein